MKNEQPWREVTPLVCLQFNYDCRARYISECVSALVRSNFYGSPMLAHRLQQANRWFFPIVSIYIRNYFLFMFLLFSDTRLKRFSVTQQANVGAIVGGVIGGLSLLIIVMVLVYYFIIKPSQEKDTGPYHYQGAAPYKDGRCVRCFLPELFNQLFFLQFGCKLLICWFQSMLL